VAIIVEGFDNSGKSTLAQNFGLEVLHPGPKPKGKWEEIRCLEEQQKSARLPVVLDRVTCISNQVYGDRMMEPYLKDAMDRLLSTHGCILIYCRPDLDSILDFSKHTVQAHDDLRQIEWMKKNALRLVSQYDQLMRSVPHMKYDWTKPDAGLLEEAFNSQFSYGAWKRCTDMMRRLSPA
jgi:hypothetical protein